MQLLIIFKRYLNLSQPHSNYHQEQRSRYVLFGNESQDQFYLSLIFAHATQSLFTWRFHIINNMIYITNVTTIILTYIYNKIACNIETFWTMAKDFAARGCKFLKWEETKTERNRKWRKKLVFWGAFVDSRLIERIIDWPFGGISWLGQGGRYML